MSHTKRPKEVEIVTVCEHFLTVVPWNQGPISESSWSQQRQQQKWWSPLVTWDRKPQLRGWLLRTAWYFTQIW